MLKKNRFDPNHFSVRPKRISLCKCQNGILLIAFNQIQLIQTKIGCA